MSKVSILIPTYNRMNYLREAINSVLNQAFQDFEIIVIDDGSTDGTQEMLQSYLDDYPDQVRYIYQKRSGVSSARNNGMRNARYEYIAFLDSDDLFFPGKLEKAVSFLDQRTEYALVYTDMFLIDQEKGFTKRWLESKKYFGDGDVFENLLKECFFIPSAVVVRKEVLESVSGFDESMTNASDIDLWLRIARNRKIGFIDEPLTGWRIHKKNLSKNFTDATKDAVKMFEKYLLSFEKSSQTGKVVRSRLGEKYFELGYNELETGQSKKAKEYFTKSLQHKFSVKTLVFIFLAILPARFSQQRPRMRFRKPENKVIS